MDVEITRLQLLAAELERAAEDPELVTRVFERADLTPAQLSAAEARISAQTEASFIRHACDVLGDITFAAKAGLRVTSASSLAAYISKYSRDLKQVMENTIRFHRFIDPTLGFSMDLSGNAATLGLHWKDARFARYHRRTEFLMFAAVARMRTLTGVPLNPIEIRFQHEVGRHEARFSRLAGFPVRFGMEQMEILLPLTALDQPIPTYDPRLREHLMAYGERLLAENGQDRQTLRSRVEGVITQSLPGRIIRAEDAARTLAMSPRTFARRLGAEGTSFRQIVDDLRCDLAQTLLRNQMTLAEVAYALGYADQSAFSTAFKRWTGHPPSSLTARVNHPIQP